MRKRINRPQSTRRVNTRDDFELCYLRHQYIRRSTYNPTVKDMKPYFHITAMCAQKTFFMYRPLFLLIGLEKEDISNIARMHLVSFLGLFSLEKMPSKYTEFVEHFKEVQECKPQKVDILDKNQANFTLFLKQRMEDLVRICRQKVKNIKGFTADGFYYYYGPKAPPKRLFDLVRNYEKLGFRKLDSAVYKSIKKRAGVFDNSIFMVGDNYYIAVPIPKKSLTIDDLNGAGMNPRDTLHNMDPEAVYFTLEDDKMWEKRQEDFNGKPLNNKTNILKNFIQRHKGDNSFREEVKTARKLLRELENESTI